MPDTQPSLSRHAFGITDVLLLLMAVIWGINFSAVKYATQTLSPQTFTVLRVVLAALAMFAVAFVQRRPWPARRDILGLLLLGVLGNGIYQLCFTNGVARTRIADAALIMASVPAFIAILGHLRGIERITWRTASGVLLSIVGVGAVIVGSAAMRQHQGTAFGTMLLLAAVVCWSIFSVSLRSYTLRIDPVHLNGFTLLGGMISMVVLTRSLVTTSWSTIPFLVWVSVVYASVVSMGIAYLLYMRGLRILGPTRTAVYGNLQPVVAILIAWMLFGEAPTMWQGAGTVCIISGVLYTRT